MGQLLGFVHLYKVSSNTEAVKVVS